MAPDDLAPLPPVDSTAARRLPGETLTPELLASLLADGDDELAAWTLSQALAESPRAEVYDGLLADAMHLVGERWQSGRWSVAEEHLASQTLLRALDRIRPDLGPDGRIGPLAVLAGVAGERHVIGLVCLDHLLRENGWTVANLGADVPSGDLATFLARNEARLVAITASDPERTGAAAEAITAARAAGCQAPVMLGGRLADVPGIAATIGADWSGRSLADAADYANDLLASHGVSQD
ncbi:MAG: B12-binding domain-containing protein [Chloroflexota bacterium]